MTHGTRRAGATALALALLLGGVSALGGEAFRLAGTVNINTATPDQLELLPGIGSARARAVVELRELRGRFEQVDDLLAVQGIGATGLEELRAYVTLQGKTTAKRN
ncbi:MAG: helix-hairpin-helix domain-containing protein [Myxococcales bacterium]|nr:helix-hairpin-helix domain-containing protein [Myxococcales bacterium]